jgi:carboxylate-amine ligase
VADVCTRPDEALCVAALVQAIVGKLIKLRQSNQSWRRYRHHLIEENKWRAVRYGVEGRLIDFGLGGEKPFADLVEELLDWLDDVLDELGSRRQAEYVRTILAEGSSADRQLATYRETGSLEAVVDRIAAETLEGC